MSEKEVSEKMQEIMLRIKKRREELDMSYQTLADKVGISKSTLQRYETGNIKNMPIDKLEDIAKALHVTPSYLMGWEPTIDYAIRLDNNEFFIIETYRKLPQISKKQMQKYASALSDVYSLEKPLLNAAHQRTDIDAPEGTDTSDNDIMDDENF